MALKEKPISQQALSNTEDSGLMNRLLPPGWAEPDGDGGCHSNGTLPIPVDHDCVQYGGLVADVGGKQTVATILATIMLNLSSLSLPGWARPEGEGGHHGDGTLPIPVDRDRVQYGGVVADVGASSVTVTTTVRLT